MASDINVDLNVNDGGSSKKTEENIKDVRERLKAAKKEAAELNKILKKLDSSSSSKGGGGTSSSRKALEAAQVGVVARQRGTAELTGAAGRDFANQAQGLGGLVRLYATFAANIFALGAAFRALSDAMDTSNMVEGLDQLGAAVGKNLGGLSKRVAELSGGAISLAEAMKAVAQTSSGGLSANNIERLALVARSASAALGVAMPDAISRLSRGITKLEPELLDELGIMTRLERSVEIYAREVGKATSQLTLFERRQAFANAVLREGEEKFGEIQGIAVNPYDKLLSSLKDVLQVGSSALNTVLVPLIDVLSSSPAALAAGIAALGAVVIRQALPALGQFKASLAAAAVSAADVASQRADDAALALQALNDELDNANRTAKKNIDEQVFVQEKAFNRIGEIRGKALSEDSKLYRTILTDIEDVTDADIKRLQVTESRLAKKGLTKEAEQYKVIRESILEEKRALKELNETKERNTKLTSKAGSSRSVFGATQQLAIEAQNSATKKLIVSNAAYNGSLIGIRGSWKLLNAEIAKSNLQLKGYQVALLKAKGAMAIFGGALSTISTAFAKLTNVLAIIGTISTIFAGLNFFFSSNAEEARKFASTLEDVEASIDNVSRTIKKLGEESTQGTIAGIKALAEAFDNLTSSAESVLESAVEKQAATTSWFSRLIDGALGVVNLDTESKLNEALTNFIRSTLDATEQSGIKEEVRDRLGDILNVDVFNTEAIQKGVSRLSKEAKNDLVNVLKNDISLTLSNTASRLESFETTSEAASLAYRRFIQSTANTDPVFRVGAALESLAVSMFNMAEQTKLGVEEINAAILFLGKNPEAGILFGDAFVEGLLEVREEFQEQEVAIRKYQDSISELDKQIAQTPVNELFPGGSLSEKQVAQEERNLTTLDRLLRDRKNLQNKVAQVSEKQAKTARELFIGGMESAFKEGAELIRTSLELAAEQGAIAISKARIAGLSGEEKAIAQSGIAQQEIDIRLRAIDVNRDLILTQEKLNATIERNTAATVLSDAKKDGKSAKELRKLEKALEISTVFSQLLSTGATPNEANASRLTNDESVVLGVRARGIGIAQRLAEQDQARILAEKEAEAAAIKGQIDIRLGILEDLKRQLTLEAAITKANVSRVNEVQKVAGIANENFAIKKSELDLAALANKQAAELAEINTKIANATNESEKAKQEEFKALVLSKQELEASTIELRASQKIISARLDTLNRTLAVVKAISNEQINTGIRRLEVAKAEVSAFSNLLGISREYAASQAESIDRQRAQLEFTKQAQNITLEFVKKSEEANQRIAQLDPNLDAEVIAQITKELGRQETIAKSQIESAKVNLLTQQQILRVTKEAETVQARYNRLLNVSSNISTNLSSSFGDVGSAVGKLSESFANLVVNSNKSAIAIKNLQSRQATLSESSQEYAAIENELAFQQEKNTRQQISGFGQIAGAAKQMFDERSQGYQTLLAVERLFHLAHLAMSVARIAADASEANAAVSASGTKIAASTAEAEASGVAAIVKSISSLPPPFNFIAGAATAAVVAGVLSALGGSVPDVSTPGGVTAEDVQKTQGTGSNFVDGRLSDRSGGVLGASSEKAEDISNSLELIEAHTSDTSVFGISMVDHLKSIDKSTRKLAGDVSGSTNITKFTSGFGTVERAAAPSSGGLFSMIFGGSSKSVEVIDKGIQVMGKFSDIVDTSTLTFAQMSEEQQDLILKTGRVIETFRALRDEGTITTKQFNTLTDGVGDGRQELARVFNEISSKNGKIDFSSVFKLSDVAGDFSDVADVIANTIEDFDDRVRLLEFETTKTTKTSSGFLGIGGGTKVKIKTESKDLSDETGEVIIDLFSNLAETAVAASKALFGSASTEIQQVLENFVVDFKVSGLGLSGDEFSKALLNESSVVLNQIVQKAFPQLEEFRELGEGFSGTLVRLATTMDVAAEKFRKFGFNVDKLLNKSPNLGLTITNELVTALGGVESFAEKTDFIFNNFFTEGEQLEAKTREVVMALGQLRDENVLSVSQFEDLTKSTEGARMRFRQLLAELTLAGDFEALDVLTRMAPAIVDITDGFDEAEDSLKEFTDSFRESIKAIIEDASLGSLESSDIGTLVGNTIRDSFIQAMSASFVEDITNSIMTELITPVLSGALKLTSSTSIIVSQSVNATVDSMIEKANALEKVLSNPSLRGALNTLTVSIAKVVTTINDNVKKLDLTFDKLKTTSILEEIDELTQKIEERQLDLIIEQEQNRLDLLQEQADSLEDSASKFKDFTRSLQDFKASLLTGDLSPLTPLQKLSESRTRLEGLFQKATNTADEEARTEAISKIEEVSTEFLTLSRLVFASGSKFTENFNFVQSILDSLIGSTGATATIDEQQLSALNEQIRTSKDIIAQAKAQKDLLNNIDNTLEGMLEKLSELKDQLATEFQRGADQLVSGFSVLDTNLDGLLTVDELKAAGIADEDTLNSLVNKIDSNGDNQVSRLEAINSASASTAFGIQSIIPILSAINSGILSIGAGLGQIADIQNANSSTGRSPVGGDVPAPDSGGFGFSGGQATQTGALIANGIVTGVQGSVATVDEAKRTILTLVSEVEEGARTARSVYDLFVSWGASSGNVASIIGTSRQEVLDWFARHDPSIPAFASGTNLVPDDMIAKIHKDERIIPKADNRKIIAALDSKSSNDDRIVEELSRLNAQIKELQEIVWEGAVINVQATDNNASSISNSLEDNISKQEQEHFLRNRATV